MNMCSGGKEQMKWLEVSVLYRLGLTEEVNLGQRLQGSGARATQISVEGMVVVVGRIAGSEVREIQE